MADCILVSYDPTNNADTAVLIVGKKSPKQDVEIINALQGEKATELWKTLITKKENTEING